MKYHFSLFIALVLCLASCSTTEPLPQGKLPPTSTSSPQYVSDEKLQEEVGQLEAYLVDHPDDTEKLLRLSSLYIELKESNKAITTLERLKALNYEGEPKAYATLGQLYHAKDDYTSALENYKLFKNLLAPNSHLQAKVDEKIAELEFKIESVASAYQLKLEKLDATINTEDSEYLSQFTIDEEQVVFTRRYNGQEDLFMAIRQEDGTYEVDPIDAVNTPLNEGAHTISADGSILIFTHCNEKFGFGACDLYQSKRLSNGDWSKPANLGERINTRHWESQPSLSADGQSLFFSSNNPNGKGGSDLWLTTRKEDGTWNIPKNLGASINTSNREESPFIHADGKTLYFRSKGHRGLGNYDVFRALMVDGKWGDVVNLGSPINTAGNDGALVVSLDGTKGYYATDYYEGSRIGHLDLVRFELPQQFRPTPMTYVKGRVTGGDNNLPLAATINIKTGDSSSNDYSTDYAGNFLIAIPVGTPVQLHIESEGYVFYSDYIAYEEVRHGVDPHIIEVELEVAAPPSEVDETEAIVLENLFFESGSAVLLPQSDTEIEYLYNLLKKYPLINIRITGHTDNVGSESDNLLLSQQRAEAVKAALVARDISASRIEAIGKGESQPIDSNDTEEGRANNRRTEFSIIGKN